MGKAKPRARRHDGWTGERRRGFLEALAVSGCVADACREAGLSTTSAYRLRKSDPEFAEHWETAQRQARTSLGLIAWKRAVDGVEAPIVRGGAIVGSWRKPSDSILRLLLGQGTNGAGRAPGGRFMRAYKPTEIITREEGAEGWTFIRGVKCLRPPEELAFEQLLHKLAIIRVRLRAEQEGRPYDESKLAPHSERWHECRAQWLAEKAAIMDARLASGQWDGDTKGWPTERE